jgi:hypothetical protein
VQVFRAFLLVKVGTIIRTLTYPPLLPTSGNYFLTYVIPTKVAQAVNFHTCIQQVSRSILDRATNYSDVHRGFIPAECCGSTLK